MSSLIIVKLSVLIIAVVGRLVHNGGSCWLSSYSLSKLIFVFNITGSFSILLSRWNHSLSMIASNFLSLLVKDLSHARFINGTMSHQSKSVLSNLCLYLNRIRAYFSTVISIFQNPLLLLLCPTCQTLVALGGPRFWIHFLSPSGVVEFLYSMNSNWSLLPWPYNNPKGIGPSWSRSNTLSWSKYLSSLVSISDIIYPLGYMHIKPGINFPLNLKTGNPGSSLTSPIFSSMVLLKSYGIDVR